jgi:hypothetical protein
MYAFNTTGSMEKRSPRRHLLSLVVGTASARFHFDIASVLQQLEVSECKMIGLAR